MEILVKTYKDSFNREGNKMHVLPLMKDRSNILMIKIVSGSMEIKEELAE